MLLFLLVKNYLFNRKIFATFTDVKILCKFTPIKVVIYSSIFLGKKTTFCGGVYFHHKKWFFTLQPYPLLFSSYTLRGELFPPFGFHSASSPPPFHLLSKATQKCHARIQLL